MNYEDFLRKKNKQRLLEAKEEKEIKRFKVGDELILTDTKKSTKLPDDAWDFLMTYKTFKVIDVKENGAIDIGCTISKNINGGYETEYLFRPNRFDLKPVSQTTGEDFDVIDNEPELTKENI